MINLYESSIEMSVAAVFESLKTRYQCEGQELDTAFWNDFAKNVNLPAVSEPITRKQAYSYLNEYLKGGIESIKNISKFFDWNDMHTVEMDLIKAEKTLEDAFLYPDAVENIIKKSDTITKVILKNNWYIILIYSDNNNIDRIHISVENSFHKTPSGLHDFSEVGFYKDKICVNLDTHKKYNDDNGYNNLYDLYITNKEYNFSKYINLAEKFKLYN